MRADELKQKSQPKANNEIKKREPGEKKLRAKTEKVLLGKLTGHEKQKVYDRKSEYYGTTFYKIKTGEIENMEKNAPEIVYAFKEVIINKEEAKNEKDLKRKEEV